MISYAQNFEDVLLARLFQGQSQGFYIDVGAWHPTLHSVTKHFYDLGWSGINIEPIQGQHRLFLDERPRDQNLNVAIGDDSGKLRFYECKDLTSLSTADEAQAEALRVSGHDVESYDVQVLTLNQILDGCGDRLIDFLKVDVEGFEAAVLRGIDLKRHRPRVLLIEATLPAVKIEDWDRIDAVRNWDEWEPAVVAAGYRFAWYDGLSRFYIRDEDDSLRIRLSLPPCVHDDFQVAEVGEMKREYQALLKDRENILDVNLKLDAAVQADRSAKSKLIHTLLGENVLLKSAQDDLLAKVVEFERQYQELLNKDGQNALDANLKLRMELAALRADRDATSKVIDACRTEFISLKRPQDRPSDISMSLAEEVRRRQGELERLLMRSINQSQKLAAKDRVIESLAIRDLERKALLKGAADVLYHRRRRPMPPDYGDFFPADEPGSGKHVAIDTLEIVFGVSGGVETYMKMLAGALLQGGHSVTLICLPDQLPLLRKLFHVRVGYYVMRQSVAVGLYIGLIKRLRGAGTRLTAGMSMATFARLREDIGADILHSPLQIFSALDFRVPSVLNLHDLQHLHFPEHFSTSDIEARNRLYGLSAGLADAIVVSSDFVRNDLIERMQIPSAKAFTVPVTWDPMIIEGLANFSVQDAIERYKLPPTYAIFPAQFWQHKNHARLVQALKIVRCKRPSADLKLVFTGYRGHSGWPGVQATIQQENLEEHVICLDHVPVEHLAALYKGAIYCIMPSTFEASSYPVIESQVLGVPAMCSNVTSLPELMHNGAGLMFDPFDVDDIAAKMLRWLDDPEDRGAHAERGRSRAIREHGIANYVASLARVYDYAAAAHEQ